MSSMRPTFVNPDAVAELECAICLDLLKQPVQVRYAHQRHRTLVIRIAQIGCKGGHLFCHQCITSCIPASSSRFPCPVCKQECDARNVVAVPFAARQINKLKLICPNGTNLLSKQHSQPPPRDISNFRDIHTYRTFCAETLCTSNEKRVPKGTEEATQDSSSKRSHKITLVDTRKRKRASTSLQDIKRCHKIRKCNQDESCGRIVELSDLDTHTQQCPHRVVSCAWCQVSLLQKDQDAHQKVCSFARIMCSRCVRPILRKRFKAHWRFWCTLAPTTCRRCNQKMKRRELKLHLDKCTETMVQCSFYEFGCDQVMKRKELQQHLTDERRFHLAFAKNKLQLRHENLVLKAKLKEYAPAALEGDGTQRAAMGHVSSDDSTTSSEVSSCDSSSQFSSTLESSSSADSSSESSSDESSIVL